MLSAAALLGGKRLRRHSMSAPWQVPGPPLTPSANPSSATLSSTSPDINIRAFSMGRHRSADVDFILSL